MVESRYSSHLTAAVFHLIRTAGIGALFLAGTVALAAPDADEASRFSQKMVREAYNFGYQHQTCDIKKTNVKPDKLVSDALNVYENVCQEGIKDKQAGKPANPDQAGTSAAELMGAMAFKDNDPAEARKWFEIAAKAGRVKAQVVLGAMYRDGGGGPKDCKKAEYWLRKAADSGSAEAQYNLGNMYLDGKCIKADYKEAWTLFDKAVTQNHPGAWTSRGIMIYNGIVGEPDLVKVYICWRIAEALGDKYASKLLKEVELSDEVRQAGDKILQDMIAKSK